MIKSRHFFAGLFFLFLYSCVKESSNIPNQGSKANYQPTTAGCEWNYRVTGTSNYVYTLKAEDRDSIINNKPYRVFSNNKDPNEYYYKTGGDYSRYANPPEFNFQPVDMLYLRDYLGVGQEWLEVKSIKVPVGGVDVNVNAEVTIKIEEKDISYQVNGTTYKNVIHLSVKPEFKALLIPIGNTSDIHYYYADSIGLIYNKTALKIPVANVDINKETKLTSYIIK
jgi:hypothetical protein